MFILLSAMFLNRPGSLGKLKWIEWLSQSKHGTYWKPWQQSDTTDKSTRAKGGFRVVSSWITLLRIMDFVYKNDFVINLTKPVAFKILRFLQKESINSMTNSIFHTVWKLTLVWLL